MYKIYVHISSKSQTKRISGYFLGFLVNGINNVNTTTLERRFDLKSAEVAWVSSSYDITAGILCIVLGYVATFSNKGRLLTLMAAVMTTGAFVLVTPHIFAGEYKLGRKVTEVCDVYGTYLIKICAQLTFAFGNLFSLDMADKAHYITHYITIISIPN